MADFITRDVSLDAHGHNDGFFVQRPSGSLFLTKEELVALSAWVQERGNFEPDLPDDVFEVPYTLNEYVTSTALVTIVGDEATGHDKHMPDYPVKLFKTDHGWDARKPEAASVAALVANQEQVDSHAEKQQVSYAEAWRYFEREGYDMSEVLGQYS